MLLTAQISKSWSCDQTRDARDPVRALLNVQALDKMASQIGEERERFDCGTLDREGAIAGFRAESARNGANGSVLTFFEDFLK